MDKFLFTDGITGVKQADSTEDLELLIESSEQPEKIRIWIYNSNEWIGYAAYRKLNPATRKDRNQSVIVQNQSFHAPAKKTHWTKRVLYVSAAAATIFLVFNFTKINWQSEGTVSSSAIRPENMPQMDIDSLITEIETERGLTIDRSTRTNLRLRNTWPERILLQLTAEKETSSAGSRFFNLHLSIDNTTGFPVDQAIVRLIVWKNNKPGIVDTFQFNNIRYDKISARQSDQRYKGDSISLDFQSIRAKAFNFCYSSALKNEPGAYNDRWFCKD